MSRLVAKDWEGNVLMVLHQEDYGYDEIKRKIHQSTGFIKKKFKRI